MLKLTIKRRPMKEAPSHWPLSMPPLIQRLYALRGIPDGSVYLTGLSNLHSPLLLGDIQKAASLLEDAIRHHRYIVVAGDYDCDGATGTATAVRGLRMLGATNVRYIVPDRFKHGYGLSPGLVDAMGAVPDVIVTVDSGIASHEGVAYAKSKGCTVIITDHHLPAETLPKADALVNPNLQGDAFPSKSLAGVGVMFYLLMALRAKLRSSGYFGEGNKGPELSGLLDIVAVGTVADLVPLDQNNRILVAAGLHRIHDGLAHAGLQALLEAAGKDVKRVVAQDIGYSIAPRLNAAGRLEDMTIGVECLLADDPAKAKALVEQLDKINGERRELQATMVAEAEAMVEALPAELQGASVVVYDASWHHGIVGLVASKLKESLHRPTFAFAPAEHGSSDLRGSGRSIPGFHLRDALAIIDTLHPGLILKFGGHAMAAGLSLKVDRLSEFREALEEVASKHLNEELLQATVLSDGELLPGEITLEMAHRLREWGPWGQAFPEPLFDNVFTCTAWRVMGHRHLKLQLHDPRSREEFTAIAFGLYTGEPPPLRMHVGYELSINEWMGRESLQLLVKYFEPA